MIATKKPSGISAVRAKEQQTTPPTIGNGGFYRIDIRPRSEFVMFRLHDVGERGGLERLTGKRAGGSWATVSWLISKDHAHPIGDVLVIDDEDDRRIFEHIQPPIVRVLGDIYRATPRHTTHITHTQLQHS